MTKAHRIRGRKWMKTIERIKRRDPLCKHCEVKGFVTPTTEIDHIVSLDNGGTNDDDNLQGLCTDCHKRKTAQDKGHRQRVTFGTDGWPIEADRRF